MLAFYDLCAVLTPCGPLKALVNLMQEDGSPDMPGLLYEAQLPAGTSRPNARSRNTSTNASSSRHEEPIADGDREANQSRQNVETAEEEGGDNGQVLETTNSSVSSTSSVDTNQREAGGDMSESTAPMLNAARGVIPLALARIYRLPLVSGYGTASSRRRGRSSRRNDDRDESTINESPLLADSTPEEYYERNFSKAELCSDVEVLFPQSGGRIEKDTLGGKREKTIYKIFARTGELRRILSVERDGKVYEVTEDDDESVFEQASSIRLGLVSLYLEIFFTFVSCHYSESYILLQGDFIFYSVMVAKAAMYSFTTFAACMLVILFGLGGTLVLLSVYHSALPALPISIFLGVIFYLLTKVLIEPWIEVIMTAPLYV